jgi:glycosyltransferase involved in cell wall biosynthesis
MLNCRQDLGIKMMPGPSFVAETDRFKKVPKNDPPIPQFLGTGNLFWYSLPQGYMDAGPRVVIEAMAAGLPVLADNWGGTVDRVTPETGWICNTKEQMVDIVKNITTEELRTKGIAAKERAKQEFVANNWIKEIIE